MVHLATPLPSSPTRGEVLHRAYGNVCAPNSLFSSPLMGEAGRGWGRSEEEER
jgi:hypothetical protein